MHPLIRICEQSGNGPSAEAEVRSDDPGVQFPNLENLQHKFSGNLSTIFFIFVYIFIFSLYFRSWKCLILPYVLPRPAMCSKVISTCTDDTLNTPTD